MDIETTSKDAQERESPGVRNEYLAGDDALSRATSVNQLLRHLRPWLDDPAVTEIIVNRPGEVFEERNNVFTRFDVPEITLEECRSLAIAAAKFGKAGDPSDNRPIVSVVLPGGERAQFVLAPAAEHGTLSITIRKPALTRRTLKEYESQGYFKHVRLSKDYATEYVPARRQLLSPSERELVSLLEGGDFIGFLQRSVRLGKNIVVAGETGSGKTTFMKSLMMEIPLHQRLVTIEDVPELFLPDHKNHVHLFYPSEAVATADVPVTPSSLLRSCLRMKPSRILLAELRGGETFDFINVCASGHDGTITSCHAASPLLTFERLAMMVLQSPQGQSLPYHVIRRLLSLTVDVVLHVTNDTESEERRGRHMTEIWYDPMAKRAPMQMAEAA